ncbi:MAG TPA: DNA-formamidopyrimidine glycosylase family protein [Casimicrobiaceae bacterium]|nr:DNA-formamidopyrimidine glycosylase family protein [Casimicrobiaceae bacterium]
MPELPDITLYRDALAQRIVGATLERIDLANPFVLRTAVPALQEAFGRRVVDVRRLGKRIVICLEGELYLVLHLMIAGRLRWLEPKAKPPGRITLAVLAFSTGRVAFTEAGTKRRAAMHLVQGAEALQALDAGGSDVRDMTLDAFAASLTRENHTLKRALTDPRLFSGIGNAYSDEILHRARLSPIALTQKLAPDEIARLHVAARQVLDEWIARLRAQTGDAFPEKVTAFRPEMAVHGKFGEPCPVCGAPVQRIVYAENECNYCARCQTGGVVLADRALSRLLHKSWPRSIDALE